MAGDVIAELVTLFSFQVDEDSYRKAQKSYTDLRFLAIDLVNIFDRVGSALLKPLEAVVEAGTRAVRMSAALGTTVTGFQELQAAASAMGVESGVLTTALTRLQRSAYEATHDNKKLAGTFATMGIALRDSNGHLKKADDLFESIVTRLAKMPDEAARTALAFRVLGRGATPLLPLIAGGADQLERLLEAARNSGVVLDEKTARAAEHLSVSTKILGMDLNGLIMKIGGGLIPIAQKLANTLEKWFQGHRKLIDSKIEKFVEAVSAGVEYLFKRLSEGIQVVNYIAEAFGGWKNVLEAIAVIVGGVIGYKLTSMIGQWVMGFGSLVQQLLLLEMGPALAGAAFLALLGVIFVVLQDLASVNSAIQRLMKDGINPGSTNLERVLMTCINLARTFRDVVEEAFDVVVYSGRMIKYAGHAVGLLTGSDAQRRDDAAEMTALRTGKSKGEVLKEMAADEKSEQSFWDSFMGKGSPKGLGDTAGADAAARRAAVASAWSGAQAGGQATLDAAGHAAPIEIHQNFYGPTDPDRVKTATAAGMTEAGKKLNFRVKYR